MSPSLSFEVTPEQVQKIRGWVKSFGDKHPVGSLTYEFTSAAIGTVLIVRLHHGCVDEKLDVTDYENW